MAQIIVLDQAETLLAVLENSAGSGLSFQNPYHYEIINGENTFECVVPANHPDAEYLVEGNFVGFEDLDGDFQLFEIRRITDLHEDTLTRHVYAEHSSYELIDEHISWKHSAAGTALDQLNMALAGTRWQAGTVEVGGSHEITYRLTSVLAALQHYAQVWNAELRFRTIYSGTAITDRFVDVLARRGSDTGRRFEYGKDLARVERVVDITNLYTAVYAYGKSADDPVTGYPQRLRISDAVWSKAAGDPVDKPTGQEWVGDPDALAQWGRVGGTRHRFGWFGDEEETDPAKLLQKAWDSLQESKYPNVTYSMKVIDLERITGMEYEKVRLGDTVTAIDDLFAPALQSAARIISIKRNIELPEDTDITLGNFLPDTSTIQDRVSKIEKDLYNMPTGGADPNALHKGDAIDTSWLAGAIAISRNQIDDPDAYLWINTAGINTYNANGQAASTLAIRLYRGILQYANSKDANGNFVWKNAMDGNGLEPTAIKRGPLLGTTGDFTGDVAVSQLQMNSGFKGSNGRVNYQGTNALMIQQVTYNNWQLVNAQKVTINFSNSGVASATITFPKKFYSTPYLVVATCINLNSTTFIASVQSINTTTALVYARHMNDTAFTGTIDVMVLSIGDI